MRSRRQASSAGIDQPVNSWYILFGTRFWPTGPVVVRHAVTPTRATSAVLVRHIQYCRFQGR